MFKFVNGKHKFDLRSEVTIMISDNISLSGNTFPIKEALKEMGFKFSAPYWQLPVKSDDDMVKKLQKLNAAGFEIVTNQDEIKEVL